MKGYGDQKSLILILREMEGEGEEGFKNVSSQIWREPSLWEGRVGAKNQVAQNGLKHILVLEF